MRDCIVLQAISTCVFLKRCINCDLRSATVVLVSHFRMMLAEFWVLPMDSHTHIVFIAVEMNGVFVLL